MAEQTPKNRSDEDLLIIAELGNDEDLARLSPVDRERAITLLGQAVERDEKARAKQVKQLTQATHDRLLHPATYLDSPKRKRQPEPEQAKGAFKVEDFFDPASPVAGNAPPAAPIETGIPFSEFSNEPTMDVPTEFEQAGFGRNDTGSVIAAAGAAIDESKQKFMDSIMGSTLEPGSFLPTSRGQAGDESIMRGFDEETGELKPDLSIADHVENLAQGFAPLRYRERRPGDDPRMFVEGTDERGNELSRGVGSIYEAVAHLIGMQMRGGQDAPTYRYSKEILDLGQMFGYFLDWQMMDTETSEGLGTLGLWQQDPMQGPAVDPEWNRGHAYAVDMLNEHWMEQTDPFRVAKQVGGASVTILKGAANAMGFLGKAVVPDIAQDDPSQPPRLVRSEEHQKIAAGVGFATDLALNIVAQLGDNMNDLRDNPQKFAEEQTTEAMDIVAIAAGGSAAGLRKLAVIPKEMKGMRTVMMLQGYAQQGPEGMAGAVVVHEAAKYSRIARKEAARLMDKSPSATGINENVRAMQGALDTALDSGDADEFIGAVRQDVVDTLSKSPDEITAQQATAKAIVGEAAHDSPELADIADQELDKISRGYLDGIEFLNRTPERTPEVEELFGDLREGYVRRTKMKEALAVERATVEDTTLSIESILAKAESIVADPAARQTKTLETVHKVLLELEAAATKRTQGMSMLRRLVAKYEKDTGKKIGLVAGASLMPYALYGDDARATEKLASLGPLFLLAAVPMMPSNKARKEVLDRAGQMLGYSAAVAASKLGGKVDDAAILKHLRSDKAIKETVELYEELAGPDALATIVIPEARAMTDKLIERVGLRIKDPDAIPKRRAAAVPDAAAPQTLEAVNKERGAARTNLLAGIASTSLGAAIGAAAMSRIENGEGGDFGPTGMILFGAIGFGFSRWLVDPKVRTAIANLRGVPEGVWRSKVWRAPGKKGEPDLEEVFTSIVEPLLPEKIPVNAGRVATIATGGAIGAAGGTALTTFSEETQPDPLYTILGGAAGIALGVAGSRRVMRTVFNLDFNPRKAFRRFIRSDAGLPSDYFATKKLVQSRMMGRIQEIRDVSIKLDKLGPDIGEKIDDFRRGNRSLDSLPPEAQILALQFGQIFDRLAMDIVEVGIATGQVKETILSNVGSYLPRLYWAYETDDANRLFEGIVEWSRAKGVPLHKLSDQDYMKKRGDELAMPKEYREALGEIRNNPAYLLAKRGTITSSDVENRRLMNWLVASEHVVPEVAIPRKVGSREVANYVKALETPDGTMKEVDARALGSLSSTEFRKLQDEIRTAELSGIEEARTLPGGGRYQFVEWNGKRFMRFDDSKKWGPLAGRFVDEDIALDQVAMRDIPESLARVLIDSGTGLFKTGKVLWNPATLARNIVSNEILADFAGVSPLNVKLYWATKKDFMRSGQDYLDARRAGLFGGEFRSAEIESLLRGVEESSAFGATAISGITKNLQEIIRKVKINKISFESLERFHEASEQFYKLLVYKHSRSLGKSIDESVAHAKKYIFDYGDVPEWIKLTRRSIFGAPFITFSYKAIPRVIEHAVAHDYKKAWKFWKWVGGMGAVNEFSARTLAPEALGRTEPVETGFIPTAKRVVSAGIGLGDPIGYKKWLPDWGGAQQILLPGTDQWGRARSYDASWTAPWGDLGEFGQGTLGRNLARAGIAWPRFAEPGNPWLHTMTGFLTGKDPFSGQDIRSPGANTGETIVDMMRWQMRLWGPQLINPAGRSAEKLWRAYKKDVGADPFVPDFWSGVASEALGLKNRTFDPRRSYRFRMGTLKSNEDDIKSEFFSLRRKGAPQETLRRKKRDIARARNMFYRRFGRVKPARNEALEDAIREATRERIERSEGAEGENWFMRALGVTGEGDNE